MRTEAPAPPELEPEPEREPRRRRWVSVTFVLAPLLAFVLLLASGFGKDPRAVPSQLVGKPAPAFSLHEMDTGRTVSLSALRRQVVVVNFWASWCLACPSARAPGDGTSRRPRTLVRATVCLRCCWGSGCLDTDDVG